MESQRTEVDGDGVHSILGNHELIVVGAIDEQVYRGGMVGVVELIARDLGIEAGAGSPVGAVGELEILVALQLRGH